MYVRQAKQFLRNSIEGFDERKYGFASVVDLLRAAGKEGVLRLERDRQGAIRVFPGVNLAGRPAPQRSSDVAIDESVDEPVIELDEQIDVPVPPERVSEAADTEIEAEAAEVAEPPVIDGETLDDAGQVQQEMTTGEEQPSEFGKQKRGGRRRSPAPDAAPRRRDRAVARRSQRERAQGARQSNARRRRSTRARDRAGGGANYLSATRSPWRTASQPCLVGPQSGPTWRRRTVRDDVPQGMTSSSYPPLGVHCTRCAA
jgi:hypothetical protein